MGLRASGFGLRAAALVAWLGAGLAAAAPTGFDHNLHVRDVAVAGADDIPCVRCHRGVTGLERPGHAACFGACHGPAPTAKTKPETICATCHVDAKKVFYPPYAIDRDFALQLGHQSHAAVACATCHADVASGGARRPPHARCAGCHDGGGAGHGSAMTACATCHGPGIGDPEPPRLAPPRLPTAFSHDRHATRGAARACTACHADIAATDATRLPRPTTATCGASGCHDGAAAFATTAACTRCHPRAPATAWSVFRSDARFVHAGSHQAAMTRPCATCHPLSPAGEPLVAGHAACAECHLPEFSAREPRICGACHNGSEPWRHLPPDRPYPAATEFGATLDHARHVGACTACHALTTSDAQLRPPRGHAACTGAGCHAVATGPAPTLAACEGCHALGRAAARAHDRELAPWSVRRTFAHASHAASACDVCHTDVSGAGVEAMPTPGKPTCAPCHDGKTAFKLTGTGCKRCHG
jgi:c(7)-type cytochrome triheme protein